MEEVKPKGVVKHILLAKFKDGIPPDQIDQLIKRYAILVHLIEPLKAFHWGKDISIKPLRVWKALQSILLIQPILNLQIYSSLLLRKSLLSTTNPNQSSFEAKGDGVYLSLSAFIPLMKVCFVSFLYLDPIYLNLLDVCAMSVFM